jgi:ASC-1-like (ASCH) protein
MIHEIKIKQCYLIPILEGRKTFEVRLNDRNYQVGDEIRFLPLQDDNYNCYENGRMVPHQIIIYVHSDLGMQDGYVVLGIKNK